VAISASNVNITITERTIEGKKKRNRCTITLSSADTYPSLGIALPTHGEWGMVRQLDHIIMLNNLSPTSTDRYLWTYTSSDGNQGTIRAFGTSTVGTAAVELAEIATTVTIPAAAVWYVEAVGW
jgi:hypothetical protein